MIAGGLWVLLLAGSWGCSRSAGAAGRQDFPNTFFPERLAEVDPARCLPCHEKETAAWHASQHAIANRPVDRDIDKAHFARVVAGVSPYQPEASWSALRITGPGEDTVGEAVGVIGVAPLIQYLLERDDGRFQTHELAYDPAHREWFNIYGSENRQPGEWGHWSGQGMNWNSNCAWCHMTEFKANYDAVTDSYASTWLTQGVSCQQCHPNSAAHTLAAEADRTVSADLVPSTPEVAMHNCASCHARREQLTPDGFVAGDNFYDHFGLTLPDAPNIYFADGQNRDENYVFGSLMLSRMGHGGVTCADCHDAHSHATILPVENNALCIRCHATGERNAPVVDLALHSRHQPGSTGDQCVACHMPKRTYMGRDPRRDHGFTSPDPALSREIGSPDACSECHNDKPIEWSIEYADAWYDTPKREARRERARLLMRAHNPMQPFPAEELQAATVAADQAAWQTTFLRLLARGPNPAAISAEWLEPYLTATDPNVRAAAVRLLARTRVSSEELQRYLADPVRLVRWEAIQELNDRDEVPEVGEADLELHLTAHADRPTGALMMARQAMRRGDTAAAVGHVQRAVSFDSANPMLTYQGALLLDSGGAVDAALELLWGASDAARASGHLYFAEGLLWAEKGDVHRSAATLRLAVERNPTQDRWWYNLALAETKKPDWAAARDAIRRALELVPNAPEYRQLAAIIARQLQ